MNLEKTLHIYFTAHPTDYIHLFLLGVDMWKFQNTPACPYAYNHSFPHINLVISLQMFILRSISGKHNIAQRNRSELIELTNLTTTKVDSYNSYHYLVKIIYTFRLSQFLVVSQMFTLSNGKINSMISSYLQQYRV